MPNWGGGNTKSLEAKVRKKIQNEEKEIKKKEKELEEYWKDNDKKINAKINRRNESLHKAEEKSNRKQELRRIAQEEEQALAKTYSKKDAAPKKLTRAEIAQRAILSSNIKEKENKKEKAKSEDEIERNINHVLLEESLLAIQKGELFQQASDIDSALSFFEGAEQPTDRHPERRIKAAFESYVDAKFNEMKSENPSLKRSQLLNLIFKQWKKSFENPMNQQ